MSAGSVQVQALTNQDIENLILRLHEIEASHLKMSLILLEAAGHVVL